MSDGETVRDDSAAHSGAEPLWAVAEGWFSAWRAGRPDGIDSLVRLVSPALWHVARAHGLGQQEAQDVVQSTWLALVRNRDSIRDPRTVLAWLTTTARRESWRVARSEGRSDPVEDEALELLGESSEAAEATAARNFEGERLWRAVEGLSERCRRLIRIIAFAERPDYAHLSTELGIPVGSIGPTRGRCLSKLRELLGEEVPDA